MEPIGIIRSRDILGEGVLWDDRLQCIWWTDIAGRRLHRWTWRQRSLETFGLPERLGSFGLIENDDRIVAAFESGIARYDLADGSLTWLARPEANTRGMRFNDGRVDRQGRFWAGTMEESEPREGRANLYVVHRSGNAERRESGIEISNGACWSLDSRTFYFADSPRRNIYAYDFDAERASISGRRIFARLPPDAYPDGATVDAEDHLWSAHWGAGKIVRYTSGGKIDRVLNVPASQPTCIAFGGPELDHLFVTSARDGLSKAGLESQPDAGSLFIYKLDCKGVAENRFVLA